MNSICIVGGGIAGLSSAYYLIKKGYPAKSIFIFESDSRFGGRVASVTQTVNNISFTYEAGAGRIASTHNHILKLINELGISHKLFPMDNKWDYSTNNKVIKNCMNKTPKQLGYYLHDKWNHITFYQILQHIFSISKGYRGLYQLSFGSFIQNELGNDILRFLQDIFGYDSEFKEMNAVDAIE